jgi:hypothetical protein
MKEKFAVKWEWVEDLIKPAIFSKTKVTANRLEMR